MEDKYVEASKATRKAVFNQKIPKRVGVVPSIEEPITFYCDNSGALSKWKESTSHKKSRHIEMKYHLIREITPRGYIRVLKIESKNKLADPFTKDLLRSLFISTGRNGC